MFYQRKEGKQERKGKREGIGRGRVRKMSR